MKDEEHTPTFDEWIIVKKAIHDKDLSSIPYFYEREVWWCCLGKNVGFEQDGKNSLYSRPVVILKIFNRELFWGLPLTTKDKRGKYYHQYEYKDNKYSAILSQLKVLSSRRLIRKVGNVPKEDFGKMKKRAKHLF